MQDPAYAPLLEDAIYQERRRGNPEGARCGTRGLCVGGMVCMCVWRGAEGGGGVGGGAVVGWAAGRIAGCCAGTRPRGSTSLPHTQHVAFCSCTLRRPHSLIADQLAVNIGTELLNIVPGRVSGLAGGWRVPR
jgi:hypothetical protein